MIKVGLTVVHCILILLVFNSMALGEIKNFNLDFEQLKENSPEDWKNFGTSQYLVGVDSKTSQNGQISATIERTLESSSEIQEGEFNAWSYEIPAIYQGEKIKLSGYIKTENVASGYAGLWLRIDPRLSFNNMLEKGVVGTTDWQKYEIELELHDKKATRIVFGGLLVGSGKMWIDNLSLTIDGAPIKKAPIKELSPAAKDTAFDHGSEIDINTPSEQTLKNLTLLGKVWGFLKYHHPAIASSKYNWDYELFRFLPKYLQAQDETERDQQLVDWIDSLGEVDACENCETTQFDAFLKPDFKWMNHGVSTDLKNKLKFVFENRSQGPHHYIGFGLAGNAEFSNENPYSNMPFPDDGFRLLTVYRYWNMIQYYFPYKHLIDRDWDGVLAEYIPRFLTVEDELAYEMTTSALIAEISDSHASLLPAGADQIAKTKGKYYPPIHVRFVGEQLVVDDYFNPEMQNKKGLMVGDVITHVNGLSVQQIISDKVALYPASNRSGYLRNLAMDILRSDDKEIEVTVLRKNKKRSKKVPMYEIGALDYYYWYRAEKNKKSYMMREDNIGYITLKNIKDEDIELIKQELKDAKGIVIDIRNYPSAFVPYKLGSFFTSEEKPFADFTLPRPNNPGEFNFIGAMRIPKGDFTFKGPLVVLVNEITQSQAEFTTMAFQAGENTTVVGSTTAGADGNISSVSLPGGLSSYISGIGVYYPNGTETQRQGVKIDFEVHPTVEGIRSGKDELLEKAIQIINEKTP